MITVEIPELTTIVFTLAIIAAILLATALISRLVSALLKRLLYRAPPLIAEQVSRGASIFIWLVGVLLVVNYLGLSLDLLLLLIALAGIAFVVAARDVLVNVAARYFMGSFIPVKIGDDVYVVGQRGKVIEINMVATVLWGEDGSVITVPNSLFLHNTSVNVSPYAAQRIVIPIAVPEGVDIAAAEAEILKLCNKFRTRLDQRFPPMITVKDRGQRVAELELSLLAAEPEKRDVLKSELENRIRDLMDRMRGSKG
ncbi:MAG: mechanosensitive ion channel family protein [Nitrososphaerota archaeon]